MIKNWTTPIPGHGGRDPGTRYGKILEKNLNLENSKQLKIVLQEQGATVYMTRNKDEDFSSKWDTNKKHGDLYRRILFIQKMKSELYLSIHLNWYNDYYFRGEEVLYNKINPKNKILAESLMNNFKKELYTTRDVITTDLYLYKNTRVPGVLIECGFLSNRYDRGNLLNKDYQKKFSLIISKSLEEYFSKIKQLAN